MTPTRIALGIEYQGTAYCGWQFQDHCNSVQNELQIALSRIANEPIKIQCAGRTDTGVHAIGQVVHFDTYAKRGIRSWIEGSNTHLPRDIRIVWCQEMTEDFHARFSAIARQYRYVMFNREVHAANLATQATWVKYPLNESSMHLAAQALVGHLDFSSFRASGCQARHPMREVQSIKVSRRGHFVFIDIQANAFLHHMVRNIAGALIEVGRERQSTGYIAEVLALKDRKQAPMTAPAEGLYFVNALYPDEFKLPQNKLDERLWM